MENKEKLLEEIKQAEQHLINLKEALNKSDTVEVAADGAMRSRSIVSIEPAPRRLIVRTTSAPNHSRSRSTPRSPAAPSA